MKTEIEIIEKFYQALNGYDIPTALKLFDPEIVRIEWEGTPEAGTFHGLRELEDHLNKGRSTWAEGGCYLEDFVVAGEKIIVLVHVKVRLRDRLEWIEGGVADGFAFRKGKILEFRSFQRKEFALAWAGMKE